VNESESFQNGDSHPNEIFCLRVKDRMFRKGTMCKENKVNLEYLIFLLAGLLLACVAGML
jgi:hypothetical protein